MEIKTEVREFVARHYLPDEPAESIEDTTPLVTSGIIDSIGMLGLVDLSKAATPLNSCPERLMFIPWIRWSESSR